MLRKIVQVHVFKMLKQQLQKLIGLTIVGVTVYPQGCPALYLIQVLFHHRILETSAADERSDLKLALPNRSVVNIRGNNQRYQTINKTKQGSQL